MPWNSPGASTPPSRSDLFFGFLKIGMLGFGGVAAYARHVIVEERRWLTDQDYVEVLGVGQALPGPNTMNAAILIGHRFHGLSGAALGVIGQLMVPLVFIVGLASVYDRFADNPDVVAALGGAASAAAGLVLGTAAKLALRTRRSLAGFCVAAAAFVMVGLLNWPLVPVVLGLGAVAIGAVRPGATR